MRLFEFIPNIDLKRVQAESEKVWSFLGVKIGLTDHFIKQIKLERNDPPITTDEIISLLVLQCYRHGKSIIALKNDAEIVLKNATTGLNIPVVFKIDPSSGAKIIPKTAIRRDNFQTTSPVFRVRSK